VELANGKWRGQPRQLEDDLWIIDTLYQDEPGVIAAYLLEGPEGLALIDVGSAATVNQVLRSVETIGRRPEEIQHIIVTHVHLDHAGASGALLRHAPGARVYVHPLGAAHLIDPTKLVASARRIYGDQMDQLWGTTLPVPAERIVILEDRAEIRVGTRTLMALHTPGHATHHMALHDASRNTVFAGDVAGVALEGVDYVRPPTPPPDLDLEAWTRSIAQLQSLGLERLYLPHYGCVTRVDAHLRELEMRLIDWGDLVLAGMRGSKVSTQLARELAQTSDPEVRAAVSGEDGAMVRRYELATNYLMTIQGYERYWRKQYPELPRDSLPIVIDY
jgi:glyoxylase-like metal-dependent hydrolase (beta-lactamase superfamily II)